MVVRETYTIPTVGTGRKDYSTNVEASVLPIVRSYQVNAYAYEIISLAAGEQKDVEITMPFSADANNHFIFKIDVTADANVLLGMEIWSGGERFLSDYGYQNIETILPQGLGLSEVTLRIKNYGDVAVTCTYSHNGVQGTEKIMPIPGA